MSRLGAERVEDPDRVGVPGMVGFDETVMQPAHRRRRCRFVTPVADDGTGQILDVFEGRDAKDVRAWMTEMSAGGLARLLYGLIIGNRLAFRAATQLWGVTVPICSPGTSFLLRAVRSPCSMFFNSLLLLAERAPSARYVALRIWV